MTYKPEFLDEVMRLIANELRSLADDVESLPCLDGASLSNEQIVQLQKIDFCSQKLKDFAALTDELATENVLKAVRPARDMADVLKLEYTKALI